MSATDFQLTLRPLTTMVSIANARISAGGPPKSLPSPGAPSTTTISSPSPATTAVAIPRRPRRSRGSAIATASSSPAAVRSANAWLLIP